MSAADAPIIARIERGVGRITLTRPTALNALTEPMVVQMTAALTEWRERAEVVAVLIDGAGERGLCAGGDLRAAGPGVVLSASFLRAEYRLSDLIARYPKPYIALMDGVVMGGGLGVSAHGSHRIVTERSRIAMPEVRIGLVPDVGMSRRLALAPGSIGMLLALTARTIGAADAITCGLADVCVASDRIGAISAAVADALAVGLDSTNPAARVAGVLHRFAIPAPPGDLVAARDWIDRCFGRGSVPEILAALDDEGARTPGAATAVAELRRMSPTALVAAHELLRRAAGLGDLRAVLETEFRVMTALASRPDAAEGVRAVLIDRDDPAWQPATLAAVDRAEVLRMFDAADPPDAAEPPETPGVFR